MANYTEYRDATDTSASPSPVIWADCPANEIISKGNGVLQFEDFISGGDIMADAGPSGVFLDAGSTIVYSDEVNGAIVLTHDGDAANDSISLFGAPAFQIAVNSGSLWFEARVKFNTAAADQYGWFVGLTDATAPTEIIPLTAVSALSDHNTVGFHKPEENSSAYDTSYKANGVTAVEVNSNVGSIVADTYVKLGMKFDSSSSVLSFFIDGVQQPETKTIPSAAGTDFPNDVALKYIMTCVTEASAANTITCDWIRIAQMRAQ